MVEAIVSVGDFDLGSEGFTGAIFGLAVWLRVEEGCFLIVVAVLFVGTNLGFCDLLRDAVEVAFLTGGGIVLVGSFWGKRVEAEFDLVCPGAGAAYLESILETLVWEGCFRNAPVVGFVGCCLLRSRAEICLVTAATELDMVQDGIARSLVEGQRAVVQLVVSISDAPRSHAFISHACSSGGVPSSRPSGLGFPEVR